jgi:hypothetical protein
MVLNVSNDEPVVEGEIDEQQQLRELCNAGHAERRHQEAEEEERRRGPRPRDLANTFDRVGERQVFRTPSANVAVTMANLDRLPNQPEIQQVREDIRAHLFAAMGETVKLAKRAQFTSSTLIASSWSRRVLEHPSRQQPSNPRNGPPPVNPRGSGDGGHSGSEVTMLTEVVMIVRITTAIIVVIQIRK